MDEGARVGFTCEERIDVEGTHTRIDERNEGERKTRFAYAYERRMGRLWKKGWTMQDAMREGGRIEQ